jgi:hemerythrin-like domain-containing protein
MCIRDRLEAVRGYVTLLRQHIQKEDNILFPMADQVLTAQDQKDLAEAFDRVEREEMGAGEHERYHAMIDEMEDTLLH